MGLLRLRAPQNFTCHVLATDLPIGPTIVSPSDDGLVQFWDCSAGYTKKVGASSTKTTRKRSRRGRGIIFCQSTQKFQSFSFVDTVIFKNF